MAWFWAVGWHAQRTGARLWLRGKRGDPWLGNAIDWLAFVRRRRLGRTRQLIRFTWVLVGDALVRRHFRKGHEFCDLVLARAIEFRGPRRGVRLRRLAIRKLGAQRLALWRLSVFRIAVQPFEPGQFHVWRQPFRHEHFSIHRLPFLGRVWRVALRSWQFLCRATTIRARIRLQWFRRQVRVPRTRIRMLGLRIRLGIWLGMGLGLGSVVVVGSVAQPVV